MNPSETGRIGEDFAVSFLKTKGFKILGKNFRTKFGEIDIIVNKNKLLIFVEVKTLIIKPRIKETEPIIDPEQHFTKQKIIRLQRAIEIYLIKNKISEEVEKRLDLIAIELDENSQVKDLRHYENMTN